jgi:hypothetical protein
MMLAVQQFTPGSSVRGPGCTDACHVVTAFVAGMGGRTDLLLHNPAAHENYGRSGIERPQGSSLTSQAGGIVETGPLRVDFDRVEAVVDGRIAQLTPNEMRLMLALARKAGALSRSRYLLEATWGPSFLIDPLEDNHLLRVNLARLRGRLGTAGDLIRTVQGMGYRLELIAPGATVPPRQRWPGGGKKIDGWSIWGDWCVCCGRASVPHQGHGRCERCYRPPGRPQLHYGPCGAPPSESRTGGIS